MVGEPVKVAYTISWSADGSGYRIPPPNPPDLPWAETTLVRTESRRVSGRQLIEHVFALIPREEGAFEVPSIAFEYSSLQEPPTAEARPPEQPDASNALMPLRAPPVPLEVKGPLPRASAALLVTALLACLLVGWFFVVRGRRRSAAGFESLDGRAATAPDMEASSEKLIAAAQCRLEGDAYGFYTHLAEATIGNAGLVERLKRRAEDVGFRNIDPTPDEMDSDYRAVERVIEKHKKEQET